ncbi:MAG: hypothetical protein ABEJ55_01155 [Halanaeroarchaeum sp.]
MDEAPSSRLLEWLKRTQGDDLRVVGVYDGSGGEWLYRRPDVADAYPESAFEESLETHRTWAKAVMEQAEIIEGGDLRATINVFDDILIINFPLDHERGALVALEAKVGEDLVEVVANGLQLLLDDREAALSRLPSWIDEEATRDGERRRKESS